MKRPRHMRTIGGVPRYTRRVGSSITRGVSILLLVLLSGTPALASVCAALCLPGQNHHEAAASAQPASAHVHEPEVPAQVAHHHDAPSAGHHQTERAEAPDAVASSERVTTPHECCSDKARAAASAARTQVSTTLLLSAPVASPELHAAVSASSLSDTSYGTALSPPGPVRSPLVLRV